MHTRWPMRVGRLGAMACAALFAVVQAGNAAAAESSFDRWLHNPYPVADGFSFPVGDGEGGGVYTDSAGRRHTGWYVATRMGDAYSLGVIQERTGTAGVAATPTMANQ